MTKMKLIGTDEKSSRESWHDNHVAWYLWMASSICSKIANVLEIPFVYCVGREAYGDFENRKYGNRIFIQTYEKHDNGVLKTFEVTDQDAARQIIAILVQGHSKKEAEEAQRELQEKMDLAERGEL